MAALQRLGFGRNQGNVPALVFPSYGLDGSVRLYNIRPDQPRTNRKGQLARYEVPRGARLHIDVPPGVRQMILDIAVRLIVCLGVRSADAAVNLGITCIALLHPRGWKTSIADLDQIPLPGREVAIVLDSSANASPEAMQAAAEFHGFLVERGAVVRIVVIPHGPESQRRNLDDFLAAGHGEIDLWSLPSVDVALTPAGTVGPEAGQGSAGGREDDLRRHDGCRPVAAAADHHDIVRLHLRRGAVDFLFRRRRRDASHPGVAVFAGMLGVTLFGIFPTPVFYYIVQSATDPGANRPANHPSSTDK
jgi:hypothetical protein